jgi:hypothetical protein
MVSKNLHDALYTRTKFTDRKTFWIDAIQAFAKCKGYRFDLADNQPSFYLLGLTLLNVTTAA